MPAPQEIDEYELVDPVDILTPLEKSGFWNGVVGFFLCLFFEDQQHCFNICYFFNSPRYLIFGIFSLQKATKWSERKDAVAELTKLASTKRIAPGDFSEICRTLKKVFRNLCLNPPKL